MKKLILVFTMICTMGVVMAQEAQKNDYVLKGDLIEATLYHDNGKVAQTGFYNLENKLQGEWISYDAQGNKTAVAYYNNGEKAGTWYFYQGATMKQVTYNDAKIAEVKTWEVKDTRVVAN
ncbi:MULTISPECIES: hypothetical protein [Altibacter]|uniref:toxin-antitoxin system YwqK family antitoxin n=1 Tax=Altibacter TaxID=1535231 RepID=UPI0005585374|nr:MULTISPECIES: hypothetical protein [Altibacter]MCW8979840.1 nicotinic acid mononucleotide adenyltransferase [Altibacter sp.]MCW9037105.1 nicotinic acid mononucleotide adenyltransferase [Altibacter sp.]